MYRISGKILAWLLPLTVSMLVIGAVWGLLYAPMDFRQGNSFRIIYFHVPASVVALAGYYVMAIAGGAHRRGTDVSRAALGRTVGQAHLGHLLGLGRAHHVHADPVLPLPGGDRPVPGL